MCKSKNQTLPTPKIDSEFTEKFNREVDEFCAGMQRFNLLIRVAPAALQACITIHTGTLSTEQVIEEAMHLSEAMVEQLVKKSKELENL